MNYRIIQKRVLWLSISSALFVVAVVALVIWGLKFGIDFTGGSLLEVRFNEDRPDVVKVIEKVNDINLGSLTVQPVGDANMILRFQDSSKEKHDDVVKRLNEMANKGDKDNNNLEEIRYDSVGPSIGMELKQKAIYAIFWVLIVLVIYISIAFHKVSKPVASWKYGLSALLAMFHDVIITIGAFAILGRFFDIEINTPFVAAILTVLGYSVHDTIVVFDRIRENLPKSNDDFEGTVNISLNQTLGRSISTSMTVILTLVAIILFGGESIRSFALALTIGIFIGTYSSIFVASPLLVVWDKLKIGKK
jgi:preprotein translocase subunit SecF